MNLFDLFATISLDSSGFERGIDNAEGKANSAGAKIGDALKNGVKVAAGAIGAASAAVTAFTTSAVKTGQEFDTNMSQIAATLGITTDDISRNVDGAADTFKALRDKAKEMGAETNFSASEAAQGLNILAMSGFSASDSMNMLEDVLHLAAAGSMDMSSAASYISGAMKGFNDATKDSGYYADLMAKGATLANTNVSQLGEAMASGAAGAAAYSQSAESMTVALLRLAEQGEVGSAAGTSLAAAMKNIYTPTDQAKAALEKLGVAAYKNGKALDFNDVVNNLNKALSGLSEEQANAYKQTIFGIQGLNAYNKMTVTSTDKQMKWADALSKASEGAGEAAKQYNTMTDNLQGDVDIWKSALDGFKIEVSDKVMPTVRSFVKIASTGMGEITEAFKAKGLSGAATALGKVLGTMVTKVTDILPKVVDAASKLLLSFSTALVDNADILLKTGFDIVSNLVEGMLRDREAISNAIKSLIKSIGTWIAEYGPQLISSAAEVLIMIAQTIAENAPTFIEQASLVIMELATALTNPDMITALLDAILQIIESIGNSIIENIPTLIETITTVIDNIVTFITENLPTFIEMAGQIILALAQGLMEALPGLLEKIPEMINSIIGEFLNLLPLIVETGITLFTALINALPQIITNIVSVIPTIIDNITTSILDLLPIIVDTGITLLTALVEALPQIITTIVEAVPKIVDSVVNSFVNLVPALIDAGITLFTALVEALPEIITTICDALPLIIDSVVDALFDMLPIIIDAGIKLFTALIDNLPQIISNLVSKMPQIIDAIVGALVGAVPKLMEAGGQLITGLWQGISNVGEWLRQKISGFFGGVVQSIKNFFGIHSPSKVFAGIGEMLDRGLAKGVGDYADLAVNAAEDMAEGVFSATDRDFNFTATGGANVAGATASRGVVINVYGAEGQNVEELAEVISQKIAFGYTQEQAVWA